MSEQDQEPDHQQLVHLPDEYEPPEEPTEKVEIEDRSKPINQWKLLKILREADKKSMALADICKMFDIEDRQDERVWFPINQLIRGSKIRAVIGAGTDGQIGTVFIVREDAESSRERTEWS